MKLYLSSFRLGDHPERWLAMLPPRARIGVVCNAVDSEEPVVREEKVRAEHRRLVELGLRPTEVDLRDSADLDFDGLWVRGGNVFTLRAAMAGSEAFVPHLNSPGHPETELIEQVRDLYDRTGVPYVPLRDGQALVVDGSSRELV